MKTYDELTKEQKDAAVEKEALRILRFLAEGYPAPSLELREIANEVGAEMDRMQTPWFFGEVMWERAETHLKGIARYYVKDQVFAEKGDPEVIWGICE